LYAWHVGLPALQEKDKCMPYEEEGDACMPYEEEDK